MNVPFLVGALVRITEGPWAGRSGWVAVPPEDKFPRHRFISIADVAVPVGVRIDELTPCTNGETQMPDAIVKQQSQQSSALQPFNPSSFDEAMKMSQFLATSNLIPSAVRGKPADVMIIMMKGRELGLSVMQSLGEIYVVEGRPSASAKLKVGLCLQRPDVCEYFRLVESTDTRATFETKRVGAEPVRMSYTIQQAQQAGLTGKNNWKNHPAAMLRARCESGLADAVYPDLVQGMMTPDEAEEIAADVSRAQFSAPPKPGPAATVTVEPNAPAPVAAKKAENITDAELVTDAPKAETKPEAKTSAEATPSPAPAPADDDPFAEEPKQADTPEAEFDALMKLIAAAKTEADLTALVGRLKALPEDLRTRTKQPYNEKRAALKKGAA